MSSPRLMNEIIAQYRKHGWTLNRVLLSQQLSERLAGQDLLHGAPVEISDIDAAWFVRPSRSGHEAWELRSLTSTPFALLEVIGQETDVGIREAILKRVEEQIRRCRSTD